MDGDLAGSIVTVDAKPTPVALDTHKTAVMVVDMQNDFGARTGMFARAGIDVSLIRATIGDRAFVGTFSTLVDPNGVSQDGLPSRFVRRRST